MKAMRASLILLLLAVDGTASARPVLPQSAIIVDNDTARNGWKIGNVKVFFNDGHTEKWTRQGGALLPAVSSKGFVGWAVITGKNDRGDSIDGKLRVCRPNGRPRDFEADLPFIEKWQFSDDGTTLIIKSRGAHGPASYDKFDVTSSRSLAHAGEGARGDGLPYWARPFTD